MLLTDLFSCLGMLWIMERLRSSNGTWLKYILPIDKERKTGVFALTPWCFYMHGIKGVFELPKHMYTSFTLMLNQGERLIVVPDYRIHELFINGRFTENRTKECKVVDQTKRMTIPTMRITLHENDQIILIRDSFFGRKIDSIINLPLIHNSIIRSLLTDLLDLNVKVEVTETLHAIANMVFIITAKKQTGKIKDNPLSLITNTIVENYKEKNFNLDKLSSIVLMSRRKVQYILSESGETFTSLVNKSRVEEMKRIINENPRVRLSELTESVGIKNCYAASKLFHKHENVSIKEYKERHKATIK